MFVVTIPDEMFIFINQQFVRFRAPYPEPECINEAGNFLLDYVSTKDYFPNTPSEAEWRFANAHNGLNSTEKQSILPGLEYRIKIDLRKQISIDQLHLAAWSALMWCWSPEGEIHVRFNQEADFRRADIQRWNQGDANYSVSPQFDCPF